MVAGVPRQRFDYELLDEEDPFEIDRQRVHLFKHVMMDPSDVSEVWTDNPLFYPANEEGDAHWLMVGEVTGDVVMVPLAPGSTPYKARPIGVYKVETGGTLDRAYKRDTR
jgi:hypothetical protein